VVLLAGEPGVGKSDPAARRGPAVGGRRRHPVPRGQRRGVGEPGPSARRAARRPARPALPGVRERPGAVLGHLDAVSPACSCSTRCRPSRPRHRGRARAVSPRSARSPPRWSGSPRSAASPPSWSVTSPRTVRSPAPACLGAPGRRRLHFEGDKHSSLRPGARGEEPLRRRRRGGLLRDARGRHHQPRRPVRPVPHPLSEPVPAPASPWPWRAAGRWSPRCRR
jgi:hypothetical protein